jgi:hypothetical protein
MKFIAVQLAGLRQQPEHSDENMLHTVLADVDGIQVSLEFLLTDHDS